MAHEKDMQRGKTDNHPSDISEKIGNDTHQGTSEERRHFLKLAGGSALAIATAGVTPFNILRARSTTRIRFNLGWRVEASGAGFLLAQQRGYYEAEGLNVTIDAGNGSAGAITAVAGGAYEAASADIGTMIEYNLANPEQALIAAAIQYDSNPNSLLVRADSGIEEPTDFAGKQIIGQPFNASRKLFPVFARNGGLDQESVEWINVDPGLGNQLFARGQHDAMAFFFFTGLLNLKAVGVGEDRIRVFRYSDYGMQSYGNAIVMDPRFIDANPVASEAFIRATAQGWLDAIANPAAGAAAVVAREPLSDRAIEEERLRMIVDGTMITEDTRQNGWGTATESRLAGTIEEVITAFGLEGSLSPSDIFTGSLLPSREALMIS
ncbi:MAG: ABC transporter substrate-binding protein [Ectothiorhodospiraceae bacterium]|nr:ABC transporter substrate-binding protein [Ectothiorhodospiraceae bacterium]MCH8503303.1 ABC transporter substrate-binding protein [Ectothiorhodospiraceae bacterium]